MLKTEDLRKIFNITLKNCRKYELENMPMHLGIEIGRLQVLALLIGIDNLGINAEEYMYFLNIASKLKDVETE